MVGLLRRAGLPTCDLPAALEHFFVAERGGEVAGAIGLERAGTDVGLLRSLVVDGECRGRGLGRALVERLIGHSRLMGIERLFLVTVDADRWFAARGFEPIDRDLAPEAILRTRELAELCPGNATLMTRRVDSP